MGISIFDESYPEIQFGIFANGDGTTSKIIIESPNAQSLRVDSLLAVNDDTIDHVLELELVVAGFTNAIASCTVPAGAGTAGALPSDLIALAFPTTFTGLILPGSYSLNAHMNVALVGGHHLTITAYGGYV